MASQSDPNVYQAWMLAIPASLTALSTWYLNRKTVKTGEKATQKTGQIVTETAIVTNKEIQELQERISKMEEIVRKTQDSQITLSQKHVESMLSVNQELKNAKAAFRQIIAARKSIPEPQESENLGKVILKP